MHVHPTEDLIEHVIDDEEPCVCGATEVPAPRSDGSIGWIVLHHSLDGRELGE